MTGYPNLPRSSLDVLVPSAAVEPQQTGGGE